MLTDQDLKVLKSCKTFDNWLQRYGSVRDVTKAVRDLTLGTQNLIILYCIVIKSNAMRQAKAAWLGASAKQPGPASCFFYGTGYYTF